MTQPDHAGGLPEDFSSLQPFVAKWDKPDTNARYAERLASSMAELEEFHGAMVRNARAVMAYLDAKPFSDYSEEDRRLGRLMFALSTVSTAVEAFKRQAVPDTGAAAFTIVREPSV
jgi:hypothetical protein